MSQPRTLPRNQEAEEAVIGGILFAGVKALAEVASSLRPDDFYHPALQAVYTAALDLDAAGSPVDLLTIGSQLKRNKTHGKLAALGGESYLADLSSRVVTVVNINHHAGLIRQAALRRRLIQAASQIMDRAFQEADAEELITQSLGAITEATTQAGAQEPVRLRTLLHDSVKRAEQRYKNPCVVRGASYGIERIDEMTGGMHPTQQIIIAGETGGGKTSFALQIASEAGIPALIFSLEMLGDSLADRMLCQGGVNSQNFKAGLLTRDDWINLTKRASTLADAVIDIAPGTAYSVEAIRQETRRWMARLQTPPRQRIIGAPKALVLVDYLQLVECSMSRKRGRDPSNREQEVAQISRVLKVLALETGAAVMALSQLNEDGALRESRAIEHNADVLIILRKEEQDGDRVEARLKKNRGGPPGRVRLLWSGPSTSFRQHSDQDFAAPPDPKQGRAKFKVAGP